jgi:ABC-2 type transport system ATP-binding protein
MLAIDAQNLTKIYGNHLFRKNPKTVLNDVSVKIEEGQIFGVLGPNGAGKTTLSAILNTLLLPDRGHASVFEYDLVRDYRKVRAMVNVSSGNPNFTWSLNVYENLNYYGMLYGLDAATRKKRAAEIIELLELDKFAGTNFEELSTGTKQRLSLAKSLLNDPRILFLDEPTSGLDPDISLRIRAMIMRIHEEKGMTIVLTTHVMREAEELCDQIVFLKSGQIKIQGTAKQLMEKIRTHDVLLISHYSDNVQVVDALKSVEGIVKTIPHDGNVIEIHLDSINERLNLILRTMLEHKLDIKDIRVQEPDLEDVFVELSK